EERFATLTTLARLQSANGRDADAARSVEKAVALPSTKAMDIHFYARQLMTDGKKEDAVKVFKMNAERFPDQYVVHVGLMRAYAALGEKDRALAEGKVALPKAPTEGEKKNV